MTIFNVIDKDKENEKQIILKLDTDQGYQLLDEATTLDPLERISVLITLDNCKEELLIIKCLINDIDRLSFNDLYEYRSPAEKYTLTFALKLKMDIEKFEKIPYTDFQKLQGDICFLSNIIKETCFELEDNGRYTFLKKTTMGYSQETYNDETIEFNYKLYKRQIKDLIQQLESEKKSFQHQVQELSSQVAEFAIEMEDIYFYHNIEQSYVDDWEDTRQSQNTEKFRMAQQLLEKEIDGVKTKMENEERVHYETIAYIEENTSDLLNQLGYWTERYDVDIEEKDMSIVKMKNMAEDKAIEYNNLVNVYNERILIIEEWNLLKEQERIEREILAKQNMAATKIQAWWRGTMVRKFIGRYAYLKQKKSKKGAKKSPKKDAKSKKKGK